MFAQMIEKFVLQHRNSPLGPPQDSSSIDYDSAPGIMNMTF